MKLFEEILMLPGAAPVLAAKISGRVISRIADGFGDDTSLIDMMDLFKAIEEKWPDQTMSLREMFELQLKDASRSAQSSIDAMEGLTPEQRELWMKNPTKQSQSDKLHAALPKIVDLYTAAVPDPDSWDELTTINKWSLLNAMERGIHDRLARYSVWAKEDEDKGKTESNAITLRDDAKDAIEPVTELITDFLASPDVATALEEDRTAGIRVPVRRVA